MNALPLQQHIVALSIPKSGTHLLANLMRALFGELAVEPIFIEPQTIEERLAGPPKVHIGHLRYSPDLSLKLRPAQLVLLVRDPRDLVCSMTRSMYSRKADLGRMQRFFLDNQFSQNEVRSFLIQGGLLNDIKHPSILDIYNQYHISWRSVTDLVLHYENLLPTDGSFERPAQVLRDLLTRLGIEYPPDFDMSDRIRHGSDPSRSATYERGESGRWSDELSAVHQVLFNITAPTLISDLGYSQSPLRANAPSSSENQVLVQAMAPTHGPADSRIAKLQGELDRIGLLVRRIKSFDDSVPSRISFLRGPYGLGVLVWTDDKWHRDLHQDHLTDEFVESVLAREEPPPVRLNDGAWLPAAELCKAARRRHGNVHFVEVGCYYGIHTMLLAQVLQGESADVSITCFDCGLAGRLAPFTFAMNGFKDRIGFRSEAVTRYDKPALVFGEYGHAENMRIVNRAAHSETLSYPMQGITLDSAFAALPDGEALVLKVAVSGGELHVLQGAQQLFQSGKIAGVIVTFTPNTLVAMGGPSMVLKYPPQDWRVYDLGKAHGVIDTRPTLIDRDRFANFADELANSRGSYTCLLLASPEISDAVEMLHAVPDRVAAPAPTGG